MSEKAEQKKKYILETAKKVFIEKGYSSVTMKDIVEACNISRGGLYLYFSDTEEIFLEVLKMDAQGSDDIFAAHIGPETLATDILALFLKEQKREILGGRKTLAIAAYDYFFTNKTTGKKNLLKAQFNDAVVMLEKLIAMGIENGEFYDVDPHAVAQNIMYLLEGLKVSALSMGISGDTIDKQLLYVLQGLVIEE